MQSAKPLETSFRRRQARPAAVTLTTLSGFGLCAMLTLNSLLYSESLQAEDSLEGYKIVDSSVTIGAFVTGLEDVPLMPDLQDVPEAAVIFDKPSGRLVEAYAEGDVEPAAVLAFYRETLPQLGWSIAPEKGATGAFVRESERLEIHVLEGQPRRTVRFVLSPR